MAEPAKKRIGWGRFLVRWALFLLLLGTLGCVIFYWYADVYEQTRPERTMDELMSRTSLPQWKERFAQNVGGAGEFEDAAVLYGEYFDAAVEGRELSYRRDMGGSDRGHTVFSVYAGPARLGTVTLVPSETARYGFGRSEWTLQSCSGGALGDRLQAVTVQIDAPGTANVCLNGVALGPQYAESIPCPQLTELEARFPEQPFFVRYTVGPLYGDIVVTAGDGAEIAPEGEIENGVCRYLISPEGTYSFRVTAPQGVEVSVCGLTLEESDATGSNKDIFRKLEKYTDGYATLTYTASGLYTQPRLTASYKGVELEAMLGEDGSYRFFFPDDDMAGDDIKAVAREFYDAYMEYSSSKYNGAAMAKLMGLILPDTELYNYVRDSYDAMIWASKTEVEYDELSFGSFHFVSDDCFTCTVLLKADFTATQWHDKLSYTVSDGYELVFIKSNGIWYAASMSSIGG